VQSKMDSPEKEAT